MATTLLDLVDQKGQHQQVHEDGTEILVAVTEVVLEVIALIFEFVLKVSFSIFQRARAPCRSFIKLSLPMKRSITQAKMGDFSIGLGPLIATQANEIYSWDIAPTCPLP